MFGFGKAKQEAWSGEVLKKGQGSNFDEDGERSIYYVVDVRRDDGKVKKNVRIRAALWNSIQAGDRITKPAGQTNAEKA